MLYQLNEVAAFNKNTAENFFTKSYKKYLHLGNNLEFNLIKISLNSILKEDSIEKNIGRPERHTTKELQRIARDLGNGVKPYLDLPIVVKNNDPDVDFEYKLIAGFGTLNGLGENGVSEYWFYEVKNATPSQLGEIATYENTCHINDTKYNTGELGIIHHIKNEIAKKHKELINTEDSIINYIDRVWPGMPDEVKGRIVQKAKNAQTKVRTFNTYNATSVKTWLDETADTRGHFIFGGKFDKEKNMYGYLGANVQDPILRAASKYIETGKKSYVVLHVKDPGTKTVKQLREHKIKEFNDMLYMLKSLGVKNLNFIKILGFLPQDTKNEDKRFLVDVNGKSLFFENKKTA